MRIEKCGKRLGHWLVALLAVGLLACATQPRGPQVRLKERRFQVEIAADPASRTQGLMFRRALAADAGMLFVFERAEPQRFWMQDCYISLDILFFDADKRFINGHYNVPPCHASPCPTYPSARPARYVLEVGGNVAQALDLREGDPIELPEGY